jgi:hypothetical protein
MSEIRKKAYSALFAEVLSGSKTFDVRIANFDCRPGDVLVLDEVNETTKQPTGRTIRKKVGYVFKTKDVDFWPDEAIKQYGYQVISLVEDATV